MDIGTQAKKGPGATLIFDAPIDDVWPMYGDLSQIANYSPGIKTVDILSAEGVNKKEGVGSVRRCNFNDGNSIVESVINSQGTSNYRFVVLRMSEFTVPLKTLEGRFTMKALEDKTEVSVEFIYRVKYGLLGKLMNALIIRKKFRGVANALLTNPAEYLKTGKMPGGKV